MGVHSNFPLGNIFVKVIGVSMGWLGNVRGMVLPIK